MQVLTVSLLLTCDVCQSCTQEFERSRDVATLAKLQASGDGIVAAAKKAGWVLSAASDRCPRCCSINEDSVTENSDGW